MYMTASLSEIIPPFHFFILHVVVSFLALMITCGGLRRRGTAMTILYATGSWVFALTRLISEFGFFAQRWSSDATQSSWISGWESWNTIVISWWIVAAVPAVILIHVLQRAWDEQGHRPAIDDCSVSRTHTRSIIAYKRPIILLASLLIVGIIVASVFEWRLVGWLSLFATWSLSAYGTSKWHSGSSRRIFLLFIFVQIVSVIVHAYVFLMFEIQGAFFQAHPIFWMFKTLCLPTVASLLFLGYVVAVSRNVRTKSVSDLIAWLFVFSLLSFAIVHVIIDYDLAGPLNALAVVPVAGLIVAIKFARPLFAAGLTLLMQFLLFGVYLVVRDRGYINSDDFLILIVVFAFSSCLAGVVAYVARRCFRRGDPECDASNEDTVLPPGIVLASRWKRLWGAVLDSLFILAIIVPTMFFWGAFEDVADDGALSPEATVAWFVFGVVIFLLLNGNLLLQNGQTLGKRIIGTRIVDARTGRCLSFGSVYGLRYLLTGGITQIPIVGHLFAVIDTLFIFGRQKRCIHDLFAGSIVIDTRESAEMRSLC